MLHLSTQWENGDGCGGVNASLVHSWRIVCDVFVCVFICMLCLFVCRCHLQSDCYFDRVNSPNAVWLSGPETNLTSLRLSICLWSLSLSPSSRRLSLFCKSFLSTLSTCPISLRLSGIYNNHICGDTLNVLVTTSDGPGCRSQYVFIWVVNLEMRELPIMIIYNRIILVVFSYRNICCWKEKCHTAESINKPYVSHVSAGLICVCTKNKAIWEQTELFYFSMSVSSAHFQLCAVTKRLSLAAWLLLRSCHILDPSATWHVCQLPKIDSASFSLLVSNNLHMTLLCILPQKIT